MSSTPCPSCNGTGQEHGERSVCRACQGLGRIAPKADSVVLPTSVSGVEEAFKRMDEDDGA